MQIKICRNHRGCFSGIYWEKMIMIIIIIIMMIIKVMIVIINIHRIILNECSVITLSGNESYRTHAHTHTHTRTRTRTRTHTHTHTHTHTTKLWNISHNSWFDVSQYITQRGAICFCFYLFTLSLSFFSRVIKLFFFYPNPHFRFL